MGTINLNEFCMGIIHAQWSGPPRGGGGATGAFCPGPHSAYGPQKIDIL